MATDILIKGDIEEEFIHLLNPLAKQNLILEAEQIKKEDHGTLGKYMFFSDDKDDLIKIAKKILEEFNLFTAKVSKIKRKSDRGFGFVLCIYDYEPRYKHELKRYADEINIKYRFWKSDKDTLEGKYSTKFLESLRSDNNGK